MIKFDKLDLGCGNKKPVGYIGVDKGYFKYPEGEFIQADINNPLPFKDNSFSEIRAFQILEHIRNDNKICFMTEMCRLLEYNGVFIVELPPPIDKNGKPNGAFFADPSHDAWWMPGTFCCFCASYRNDDDNREVYEIGYGIKTQFEWLENYWINDEVWHGELVKLQL